MSYLIKKVRIGESVGETVCNSVCAYDYAYQCAMEFDEEMIEDAGCEMRGMSPSHHHIVTDCDGNPV